MCLKKLNKTHLNRTNRQPTKSSLSAGHQHQHANWGPVGSRCLAFLVRDQTEWPARGPCSRRPGPHSSSTISADNSTDAIAYRHPILGLNILYNSQMIYINITLYISIINIHHWLEIAYGHTESFENTGLYSKEDIHYRLSMIRYMHRCICR